jgi:uncharacterized protein (TIGR03435 family)
LIPVLDKTGLQGIYEFSVNAGPPELGTDAFTGWKRILEEQLGLRIESGKGDVPVVVVDDAEEGSDGELRISPGAVAIKS